MNQRIKHLFRKYLDNSCSREEFDELFAYVDQERGERSLDELLEYMLKESGESGFRYRKKRMHVFAMAAAFMVVMLAIGWLFISRNFSNDPQLASGQMVEAAPRISKSTDKSEYKYLLLPDSTQVWLNADSQLDFPAAFDSSVREVHLRGEAFFDVRHAEQWPFIIYTGKVSTEVLGTAFNIKAYPDMERITVSVKRGKVKVHYANKEVAVLTKGKELAIGHQSQVLETKQKAVKEEDAAGWQEGNLVYDDYLIGDILADLERVYNVKIHMSSPELKSVRVSTTLKRQYGVESALDILSRLTGSEINIRDGSYIINR